MKTRNWIVVLSLLLVSGVSVVASEKPKQAAPKPAAKAKAARAAKAAKPEQVALTGSYIKRTIHRSGVVTDGPNPVFVVDNDAIRNSGASDLRQLLVFKGVSR